MKRTFAFDTPRLRCQGFSLIDAVVTLTLFGIVAAFAVPRFTRLANSARASEVEALGSDLRYAAQVAHSQYLSAGANRPSTTLEGKVITLRNGYPDATSTGIRQAIFDSSGFNAHANPNFVIFQKTGAPSSEQCSVTYNAAPAPTIAAAVTNIDTSGC
jgi:MSHA pilin protein MshA